MHGQGRRGGRHSEEVKELIGKYGSIRDSIRELLKSMPGKWVDIDDIHRVYPMLNREQISSEASDLARRAKEGKPDDLYYEIKKGLGVYRYNPPVSAQDGVVIAHVVRYQDGSQVIQPIE